MDDMEAQVSLRPMTAELYREYFRDFEDDPDLYADPEAFRPYVYSPEAVERYVARQEAKGRLCFAVYAGEELAGELLFKDLIPGQSAVLSICLRNARFKNRGLGTQAERLAVEYAFQTLDLPVLYADTLTTNTRSQRVLEKVGFRCVRTEGIFNYYEIRRETLGPHPEAEALREELARLRASLTALLFQKDELLLIQGPRVEAAYLRRFGALELRAYETWCECLRAKRKARLLRARRNRREAPDLGQIETELDGQLAAYRQELTNRLHRVEGALEGKPGPGLTPEGAKEAKGLYRRALKALHPDLHPGTDEDRLRTLDQAVRAYRAGDLETLRAISETLTTPAEPEPSALEALREEVRRLKAGVRAFDRELEDLKDRYPYRLRVYLEDEEKGRSREAELRIQINDLQNRAAAYATEIAGLLDPQEDL